MATTTAWTIPLFDDSSAVSPIQAPLNAQSNALDAALTRALSGTTVDITTFGQNWTPSTGAQKPRITKLGTLCFLAGTVSFGSSAGGGAYTNVLTVPTGFRPTSSGSRLIGTSALKTSDGNVIVVGISLTSTGTVVIGTSPSFATVSLPFSVTVPFACFWHMD